jgi:WhiB family transcriptional regulator, redox-sensing transcriptional regulator
MSNSPVERRVYPIVPVSRPVQAAKPGEATRRRGLVHKPEPWMREGACRNAADPDAWFPERGEHGARIDEALRICREECPVRLACLSYALNSGERDGIWGGMTASARTRPSRRRRDVGQAGTDHGDAA